MTYVIAEVKANGGHLVIPEGVTEIASPSFNSETGEGNFDKGFSSIKIGQLNPSDPDVTSKLQDPNINIIKSVSFPFSLTKIGFGAFIYCTNLSSELVIPNNVNEIGEYAFASTSITSLKLGNNVKTIGYSAFYNCYELSGELIIPTNVETIGYSAFTISNKAQNKITNISISKNTIYDTHTFENRPAPVIRQ